MRLLFIGDVYAKTGRDMLFDHVARLKNEYKPTVTIVNGENAAGGRGITEKIYKSFMEAGADVVTLGNHAWDNKEIFEFMDRAKRLVRPANYPGNPGGQGQTIINVNGVKLAVMNLQGRTFLPAIDCPFEAADQMLAALPKDVKHVFIDFHAEATSEKLAFAWHLAGRVSAVVGTHTHVQTADNRVLPGGTAYITDVGMTGPYNGIIGVKRDAVIGRFRTGLPARFESAEGPAQLSGVFIDLDDETGVAKKIDRILINEDHPAL